ncbi:MAG: hypothetical protein COT81_05220 [Candidatus Buchananbacteria bacterium CG10_big_fil_rev_8_21_14_0_10_42_9]|uniref:Uncharacterized protein n=1 Tax=Candidatus Buchananbacteria bacterium CG10_big_fil_rev_8_21_14_0_10_42_9 TaxID=1974526 RepID=A0A2H0W2H5_9BACT|nr:MAG: hypothetical protein COT81_05220 [Candidatus Buchananbacteria bacterium CG10_big_fil_rev_8_21_14_0_10_42_9]
MNQAPAFIFEIVYNAEGTVNQINSIKQLEDATKKVKKAVGQSGERRNKSRTSGQRLYFKYWSKNSVVRCITTGQALVNSCGSPG